MKNQYENKDNNYEEETFLNASSSTDCTGLIPAAPENEDEIESYEDIYSFLPKAAKRNRDKPL